MAQTYKRIEHTLGLEPTEYFIVKDASGVAIDIEGEGWTVEVKVRRTSSSSVLETFSTANGKVELSTTTTGRFDFTGFGGSPMPFGDITFRGLETEFIYDIQVTDSTGDIHDTWYGEWVVRNNI